jgi:hypothetical protein
MLVQKQQSPKYSLRDVCYLGLDGLDINITEKLNLTNILQVEHGPLKVPVNVNSKVPESPSVWATFLTGRLQKLRLIRGKTASRYPKLQAKTFISKLGGTAINAPYHNMNNQVFDEIWKYRENKYYNIIYALQLLFEGQTETVLNGLKTPLRNPLKGSQRGLPTFAYIHYPDVLQHFWPLMHEYSITNLYNKLDKFVAKVKMLTDKLVVVADHGFDFKEITHSCTGFYSSSFKLEETPKDITYFCRRMS